MKKPGLTVLMTGDTLGGVWDYCLELASNLRGYGVRTILATMGTPPRPDQQQTAARIPDLRLITSSYKLEWMPGAAADVSMAGTWLLQLEKEWQPDLIHLNGYAHAVLPWKSPCLVAGHSCVLSWWRAVKGEKIPGEWSEYAAWVKNGLQAADRIVAPTSAFLRELISIYGFLPAATSILNGRNPAGFRPGKKENFILSAGRIWDEAKNISALEAAACGLDWPIMVADCNAPEQCGRRPAMVSFLGHLPAAVFAEHLSRAAVYVLPARYEPFGLTVLEAALSGCALVLGDIPTLRELWNGAALFVAPDDHQGLTITLETLIRQPRYRSVLAKTARRRAMQYTGDRMARTYLTLYQELCSSDHRRLRNSVAACA